MANTATVAVTSAAFVDLGALPLTVENPGPAAVYIQIAMAQPNASTKGHELKPTSKDGEAYNLNPWEGDTRHAWARAATLGGVTTTVNLIVTGAP